MQIFKIIFECLCLASWNYLNVFIVAYRVRTRILYHLQKCCQLAWSDYNFVFTLIILFCGLLLCVSELSKQPAVSVFSCNFVMLRVNILVK
jgi:hypothetical protein